VGSGVRVFCDCLFPSILLVVELLFVAGQRDVCAGLEELFPELDECEHVGMEEKPSSSPLTPPIRLSSVSHTVLQWVECST
jgi:hypothetical protein